MKLAIFVEGGGKGRNNAINDCRHGFGRLFEKVLPPGSPRPIVVPCGTRSEAYAQFVRALTYRTYDDLILLVDSEAPVTEGRPKWLHVHHSEDKWTRPGRAEDGHLHFMAECMETWIVADPKALAAFYGKGFNVNALPPTADLETLTKTDVADRLAKATKDCGCGAYHKTKHGFALLGTIDPGTVERRCPTHAGAFFAMLRAKLAGG